MERAVGGVVEQAAGAVGGVEGPLGHVARRLQQVAHVPGPAAVRDQVDVGVLTSQQGPRPLGAPLPDGDAAEQAHGQLGVAGDLHQTRALLEWPAAHSGGISRNVLVSEIPWLRRYSDTPRYQTTAMIGATNTLIIGPQPRWPPNPVCSAA